MDPQACFIQTGGFEAGENQTGKFEAGKNQTGDLQAGESQAGEFQIKHLTRNNTSKARAWQMTLAVRS
jgi:hypothetical protein